MADPDQWERFTTMRSLHPGETLFKEGEPAQEMFIIKSGQVMITKDTPEGEALVLGYRGPGEFIGEIALISQSPRTASVVAVKPTELLVISHEQFWQRLRSQDDFRQVVMDTLISRLLAADESRVMAEMWERQLTEGVTSLASEQERLEKVINLRRETLHFIIHDLRNPLNLAITALAMIELDPNDERAREIHQFITMAQAGLNRVMLLVDSLLDVERLEQGEGELHLEQVDLAALLRNAVDLLRPMAETSRVALAVDVPGDVPRILADRTRIDRVVMNLLDNALRFTPAQGSVTVRARQDGDRVVVSVNDTGRGIPAEQRERVFDRFMQVNGVKTSGFGLGLAYCRSAIQAHGGDIRAEQGEGGVGAKMVFWLPVQASPAGGVPAGDQ